MMSSTQQDVSPLELRLGIVQQADVATRFRARAVARRHEEIDLQGAIDLADQVAQEDERPLEEPEHQQIAVRIGGGDLTTELRDARGDGVGVEDDARERLPARPVRSRFPG
jgi:hypothetical protein